MGFNCFSGRFSCSKLKYNFLMVFQVLMCVSPYLSILTELKNQKEEAFSTLQTLNCCSKTIRGHERKPKLKLQELGTNLGREQSKKKGGYGNKYFLSYRR